MKRAGARLQQLGYAYYANKEYPKAMDAFGKALAHRPRHIRRKGGSGGRSSSSAPPPIPARSIFLLAKSYAKIGDAEHAAHYLKLARDDGYKDFAPPQRTPISRA